MWLITGKRHEQYKRMCAARAARAAAWLARAADQPPRRRRYIESIRGLQKRLLVEEQGLTYVAELKSGRMLRKMDHLVCFLPGTLALGAQNMPEFHDEHMALASKLVETCYQMYARQRTGLAPEFVKFQHGMQIGAAHNLLRPETLESIFYMWRFTKDPKYREWGWRIFMAFEQWCASPPSVALPRRTGACSVISA